MSSLKNIIGIEGIAVVVVVGTVLISKQVNKILARTEYTLLDP